MKYIKLTKGRRAFCDEADFDLVSKYKWCFSQGYAYNSRGLLMHKLIMATPNGTDTDHINGNKLDNRKVNLRLATRSQNMANTRRRVSNASGYKGVSWKESHKMWRSTIKVNYKQIHLGYFNKKLDAAKAYDKMAVYYFKEFAKTNGK